MNSRMLLLKNVEKKLQELKEAYHALYDDFSHEKSKEVLADLGVKSLLKENK